MISLLTIDEVELLLAGIFRYEELMREMSHRFQLNLFRPEGFERGHGKLCHLAIEYYKKYQAMPSEAVLRAEFKSFQTQQPGYLLDDQWSATDNFLSAVFHPEFALPESCVPWLKEKLDQFLVERVVLPKLQHLAAQPIVDQKEIDDLSSTLRQSRVSRMDPVNPFECLQEGPLPPAEPIGVRWFDMLVGGLYDVGGDMIGMITPSGWGKTLAAVELVTGVALCGHRAVLLSYEQPLSGDRHFEMTHRAISCACGIPRDTLALGRASLSPEQRDMFDKISKRVKDNLLFFDMSTAAMGSGGFRELDTILNGVAQDGRGIRLVAVDWLGLMLSRRIGSIPKSQGVADPKMLRPYAIDELSHAISLSKRYNTNFFITHQASSDVSKRSTSARPTSTDAADFKNMDNLMTFMIGMTTPDEREYCSLHTTKARNKPISSVSVRRNGLYNRFDVVDAELDPRTHKTWLERGERHRVQDEHFGGERIHFG